MSGQFGGGGFGGYGRPQIRIGGPMTPAVKMLLIANAAVFLFTFIPSITSEGLNAVVFLQTYLGMTPALFWGQFTLWMPFTYLFLHGGLFHILFNLLMLWMFGGDVENVLGTKRFVIYYFVCGVGAGLLVAALQPGMAIPTIGASGAIYGVLLAYGLFFPERVIYVYGIFPVKAKILVLISAVLVFLSSMSSQSGGISHIAHLGGLVFGFIYIKRNWLFGLLRGVRKKRKKNAKVIQMEEIRRMFEDSDDDDHKVH